MTQAITREKRISEEIKKLTSQQQQEVLDFIEFLQYKAQNQGEEEKEKKPVSAYEAAKEFAGCVDFGPGDLATNKEYLKGIGKQ